MPVQGIIRAQPLPWYAQQPLSAMLKCLKVDILRYQAGVRKNEISADIQQIVVSCSWAVISQQMQRQLALWALRSCICYSGKLIAGHQASYKVASVTLRVLFDSKAMEY